MRRESDSENYYRASANRSPPYPAIEGDLSVRVCVIGAGFTGLSTALHLAESGHEVALIEANDVGWGASGRNGGQIHSGFAASMERVSRLAGPDGARTLWALAEEGKALIAERVARHAIACDLKPGCVIAAIRPRQLRHIEARVRRWREVYGYDRARKLGGDELRAYVGSDAYIGGLLDEGGGHLHPLNYALGLAEAAAAAGVRIHARSRAVRLSIEPDPLVETGRGRVRAEFVVLCGNAYLAGLVPSLERTVMPVRSHMIATEPLGEPLASTLLPADVAVTDANFVPDYFRLSADRRMLFGAGASYSTLDPLGVEAHLRRRMARIFPDLARVRIEHRWEGLLAITMSRVPRIGRLSPRGAGARVLFAHGYSGHGVALSGVVGKLLAEAVGGQIERFDSLARLEHKPFPGGRFLRIPTLVLGTTYYRLRDLL
ncbi:MAG: NAD(P)/FAD-dependent oxidoreductase [Alphaproteobacteria bacterium]